MTSDRPDRSPARRRAPSVAIAFRTLMRTLRHGYENLGTLLLVSLLWYAAAILILPIGVGTAALHRVVQPMTEERSADWRSFFSHLRADLRWSSLLTIILALGFFIIRLNIGFYGASDSAVFQVIAVFFGTLLIIWLGIALFAFPLALRQQEQHLRTTLRNALIMVFANAPGVLISLVLLLLLVVVLVFIPPLFAIVPGVIALWSAENTRLLLVASGYVPRDEIADREKGSAPPDLTTRPHPRRSTKRPIK
ncbi:MAG TPA: DUF624 domain-containing protein [Herpetosiphonaceae bacterium]